LRVYSIEAWAKYTPAADYDQPHHRDYLNHTVLVPAADQPLRQVEMFGYLFDVPAELGPPSYVPLRYTEHIPALPNWYPPRDGSTDPDHPGWISTAGRPDLYEAEVSAAGPVGTVVAYRIETLSQGHRPQPDQGCAVHPACQLPYLRRRLDRAPSLAGSGNRTLLARLRPPSLLPAT